MFDNIREMLSAKSEPRSYINIPKDNIVDAPVLNDFEAEACYLALWLTDMHLRHRRVLYQDRVPAVHSYCRFLHDGERKAVPKVVGIGQVDGVGRALDRIINLNHPVFGPVPYQGDRVDIVLALLSIEVQDYGQDLLNLLSDLSALGAQGELDLASAVLAPLKKGVDKLFGLGKVNPHLAISDSLAVEPSAPNRLVPGYHAVIDAPPGTYSTERLWNQRGKLLHGASAETATAFDSADYFVFFIENRARRQDWSSLKSINDGWTDAVRAAGKPDNQAEIDMAFQAFKNSVLASQDLIWNDKVELVHKLQARMRAAASLGSHRGFMPTRRISLSIDDAMDESVDADAAPPLSRDQLIAMKL